MGEPVQAIRVISEKQFLLIMVGINAIFSCGKNMISLHGNSVASQGGRIWISYIWRKLKWLQRQKNIVHIEVLCILERHWWKVRAGVSGFLTFKNIWHDLNYKNANNFFRFKLPKNMHIEFLCISEVAAGKMTCYHFKSRQGICTLVQNGCINQR